MLPQLDGFDSFTYAVCFDRGFIGFFFCSCVEIDLDFKLTSVGKIEIGVTCLWQCDSHFCTALCVKLDSLVTAVCFGVERLKMEVALLALPFLLRIRIRIRILLLSLFNQVQRNLC